MMLHIDTTHRDYLLLKLDIDQQIIERRIDNSLNHDQILLASINQLLSDHTKSLSDLTSIEVACGPGSFTGTRVGVTVANTLSMALNIPVNGLQVGQWVAPRYDRPANITLPKQA